MSVFASEGKAPVAFHVSGVKIMFGKTIIALMYADTPYLLFGWIPLIGLITAIWSLVLSVLGIRQFQELTTGRAILAIFIPIIIIGIIVIVAAIAVFTFAIGPSREMITQGS